MSPSIRRAALFVALAAAAACSDGPLPTTSAPPPPTSRVEAQPAGLQEGLEGLARAVAMALARSDLRTELRATLAGSPDPERKLSFQAFLDRDPRGFRSAVAAAAPAGGLSQALAAMPALEVYFPVAEHRARWTGGADFLVATVLRDGDTPVAFDRTGRRILLDATRPPSTPVLALVPAEQPFKGLYPLIACPTDGCTGEGGGGSVSGGGGLYMTYASFTSTFESWLKGNPEFETHIMGQDGSTSSLKDYQCAGEHAGGPYVYDQNAKTWSGAVLLFSDAQLAAYRSAHPDQAVRVLVVEDDDGACEIKTDRDQLATMFKTLDALYQLWTGGKDDLTSFLKVFRRATVLQQAYTGIASLIKTNDEVVGTAIEDDVVGLTWPGTNWIVKAKDNVTNGGIYLEMR